MSKDAHIADGLPAPTPRRCPGEAGPSLRWATAKVERTSAKATAGASKGSQFNDEPPF